MSCCRKLSILRRAPVKFALSMQEPRHCPPSGQSCLAVRRPGLRVAAQQLPPPTLAAARAPGNRRIRIDPQPHVRPAAAAAVVGVCGRRCIASYRSLQPRRAISCGYGVGRAGFDQETARRARAIRTKLRRGGGRAPAPSGGGRGPERRRVDVDRRRGFAAAGDGATLGRRWRFDPGVRRSGKRFAAVARLRAAAGRELPHDQKQVARCRFLRRLARFDAASTEAAPAWNLRRHLRV